MLQVKDLCVEIGGKLVVNGASFAVMPRDKVGLVGRNGAGKTTLFKVLGGANEPKSGVINRKGGFGYLPQDPRIAGSFDARTAISHILSGRGIDEDVVRIEKLRIALEENSSDANVAKFTKAEEAFSIKGGYAADSEKASSALVNFATFASLEFSSSAIRNFSMRTTSSSMPRPERICEIAVRASNDPAMRGSCGR